LVNAKLTNSKEVFATVERIRNQVLYPQGFGLLDKHDIDLIRLLDRDWVLERKRLLVDAGMADRRLRNLLGVDLSSHGIRLTEEFVVSTEGISDVDTLIAESLEFRPCCSGDIAEEIRALRDAVDVFKKQVDEYNGSIIPIRKDDVCLAGQSYSIRSFMILPLLEKWMMLYETKNKAFDATHRALDAITDLREIAGVSQA